ncbi:hypothetical protein EBZ35_04705 [bacterium]|nr:hypothetical protein [bacterium]
MAHNGIIGSSGPPLLEDDGISDQQRPASRGDTAHAQTKQGVLGEGPQPPLDSKKKAPTFLAGAFFTQQK